MPDSAVIRLSPVAFEYLSTAWLAVDSQFFVTFSDWNSYVTQGDDKLTFRERCEVQTHYASPT